MVCSVIAFRLTKLYAGVVNRMGECRVPKAFETTERESIRLALMDKGLRRFAQAGIRAARIDDFCRDVGIAKGSFYAFFPSKEDLFMAIVEKREELHRNEIARFLEDARGASHLVARKFFDMIMMQIESDPVLNIVLANGEIPHLRRKLGDERFAAGQMADLEFARTASRLWGRRAGRRPVSAADLLALLTIMLSLGTHRTNMTVDQYGAAVALLRQLFVAKLAGDRS